MKVKVGDRVFWVAGRDRGFEAEVTEVGRKWVTVGHHGRFDIRSGEIDGGRYSSPGFVYSSRQEWVAELALNAAWVAFLYALPRGRPEGLTLERLAEVRRLLDMEK